MAETFYTALGVDDDADGEAIRAAFRERVKEHHPDVSDDPGAPQAFKRLTTAREVLVDPDERARYDRLGHETYVERYLGTSAWALSGATDSGDRDPGADHRSSPRSTTGSAQPSESARTAPGPGRHRRRPSDTGERSAWLGDDWERPERARRARRSEPGSGGTASGAATADWQRASDVYQTTSTVPSQTGSRMGGTTTTVLESVGPWVLVHLLFLLTAIGTAVYAYASFAAVGTTSMLGVAVAVLLVGLALTTSALHVVSLLYS